MSRNFDHQLSALYPLPGLLPGLLSFFFFFFPHLFCGDSPSSKSDKISLYILNTSSCHLATCLSLPIISCRMSSPEFIFLS